MPQRGELGFGQWSPDLYNLDTDRLTDVTNALPFSGNIWGPFKSLEELGESVGGEVRGAISVRKPSDGTTSIYCGTVDSLFKWVDVATAWEDVSGTTYALPDNAYWDFTPYSNQLVACQGGNTPQVISLDAASGTNFAALGGSPPTARRAKFIGNYLVLYDLVAGIGSPADPRAQFINSGFNNPAFWTPGQRSCDYRTFLDGGPIAAITGRTSGLLIQRDVVRRITPSAGDEIWNITKIEEMQGTVSPYSVIENRGAVLYYSRTGWVASGAQSFSQEVGLEWVDEWTRDNVNLARASAIQGVLDPLRSRYYWLCPSSSNTSNVLDLIIGFDAKTNRFFKAQELQITCLARLETAATTLSGLSSYTLSTMPAGFGSPIWSGGQYRMGGFGPNYKIGYFSGDNLEATFKTARFQPIPGRRSYVAGYRLLSDASDARGMLATAENAYDTLADGTEREQEVSGLIPGEQTGRWHQVTIRIPAAATWTSARGVALDEVTDAGSN